MTISAKTWPSEVPERRTFTTEITARSYELDGFRHVNNAVFAQYLEAARGDWFRAMGIGYAKFHEWAAYPVVTRLTVEYRTPARADDELEIDLRLASMRRTQFLVRYEIRHGHRVTVVVRAETRHAFVAPSGNPVGVPEEFREAFEGPESGSRHDRSLT